MIDLYQLHSIGTLADLDRVLAPGGAYEALVEARAAGKIRWIGITGHSREIMLKAIRTGLFDTAQFPFNPIETEWEEEVIPAAKAAGVGTICMKPLAGGAIRNARSRCASSSRAAWTSSSREWTRWSRSWRTPRPERGSPRRTPRSSPRSRPRKKLWGDKFCRRCGYCLPCPNGLNIPFLFLIDGYYTRYELKDWALARLSALPKKFGDCAECGECLEKCPYGLAIPDMMKDAAKRVV